MTSAGPETKARWGAASTRTVAWHDPAVTASAAADMSGLAFLRALRDGVLAPPPMAAVLGFAIEAVEPGRVVFTCTPDGSSYNPSGTVHGGLVCTLADSATACAVHSTLEAGVGYTSIDLAVSYLRPVRSDSGVLRAEGVVTKPGRRVAFARAEIVDGTGRPVATATSSCLIMDRR